MRARTAIGAVGAVVTLVGGLTLRYPDTVLQTGVGDALARPVTVLDPVTVSLAGVGLVALALVVSTLVSTDDRVVAGDPHVAERFDRTLERSDSTLGDDVPRDDVPRTGQEFDWLVDRAIAGDAVATDRVRDRLRNLASEQCDARRGSHSTEQRGDDLEAGTWTDDRTAAAFLAGPDGPMHSFSARLRLWLDPERERARRIERTVEETATLDGEDR